MIKLGLSSCLVILISDYIRVVMAYVFDPLLPGVCLHASCHTLFLGSIVLSFLSLTHLFLELFYYFYYYLLLRVF